MLQKTSKLLMVEAQTAENNSFRRYYTTGSYKFTKFTVNLPVCHMLQWLVPEATNIDPATEIVKGSF